MTRPTFLDRLHADKILISDGATGTNLQQRGLKHGDPPELWLFNAPEKVLELHHDFIAAGSDIILTNSFGGTAPRLAHAGLQDRAFEVNQRAAQLARQAAEGTNTLVAGSLGPIGQLIQPLGELSREEAVTAYADQARALEAGGADLLVIETQFDLGEAAAAIEGVRSASSLPLVCSFSYDMGVRTMMGLKPGETARELAALGVDVIGINCGRSLEDNEKVLAEVLAANTGKPVWMKPNAGLPRLGEGDRAIYDLSPQQMGEYAAKFARMGARIVGGCCGTSPEHLRHIALAGRAAVMI